MPQSIGKALFLTANLMNAMTPRAPTFEILGRRVERLRQLIQLFSGKPGSSDITSPLDQVTTIPFLLEGDVVEYYHSLTKQVQDDGFELMCVLGERFDCISREPVYLWRMLTLRESEFP